MSLLRKPLALSLLSGSILCLSWPAIGHLCFLIFVAFIPMLIMEQHFYERRSEISSKRIFLPAFLGFLLWNIGTTYFIFYIRDPSVSPMAEFISKTVASGLTYVLNSCFMAIVFWLFHSTRRRLGARPGYISLVLYWMSFEFIHMHWSINWPWLNLGNVFAEQVWMVQWYEYTGSPGGTLWVLSVNLLIFFLYRSYQSSKKVGLKSSTIKTAAVLILPILWSIYLYKNYEEQGEAVEVVCVQPNLDPYSEKFATDPIDQLARMMDLADSVDTDNTRIYVLPETAIQENAILYGPKDQLAFRGPWEHNYNQTKSIRLIQGFLKGKDAAMVAGVADREYYLEKESNTARHIPGLDIYYDSYNSTLLVTEQGVEEFYRKSKLVPGVESIPFVSVLAFLDDLALDLGGASGSLGSQETREVFEFEELAMSPTICYESVFGEFNTEFIRNGSQAIIISTNDSWWQSSPGYRQLLDYGRLRAIETRKGIARSANTGITCFIDQKGELTESLDWWTESALKGTVHFNSDETFYVRHGDYLSRLAAFVAVLLLLWSIVKPIRDRHLR